MSQSNGSLIVSGKLYRGVSFFCQKLSKWKGNYARLVNVSSDGISTYNPERGVLTNYWSWDEIINVYYDDSKKNAITIEIREKKTKSKLHFRSANSSELLCEIRSHLKLTSTESAPYVFSAFLLLFPNIEKRCELLVESGYLLIRFFENHSQRLSLYYITDACMVGKDDLLALYYNGVRHMFRISERFGFLSALSEEMHRCALSLDKTKLVDSLPASDFDLIEPPYYSFTVKDVLVNLTMLDSFDVPSSNLSLVALQSSSQQRVDGVSASVSSSTTPFESPVTEANASNEEGQKEATQEESNENAAHLHELRVELSEDVLQPSPSPIASPSILHQPLRSVSYQFFPNDSSYHHSLVMNSTSMGEMVQVDGEKYMIRHIPFTSILQLVADLVNRHITVQYEYQSKLCTCCFCCDQIDDLLNTLLLLQPSLLSLLCFSSLPSSSRRFRGSRLYLYDISHFCQEFLLQAIGVGDTEFLPHPIGYFDETTTPRRRSSSSFSFSDRFDRQEVRRAEMEKILEVDEEYTMERSNSSERSEDAKEVRRLGGGKKSKGEKREAPVSVESLMTACECYLANARYIESVVYSIESIKRLFSCIEEVAGKDPSLVPELTHFVSIFLLHCATAQSSTVSMLIEPFFARVLQSDDVNTQASGFLALTLLSSRTEKLLSGLLTPSSSLLESLVGAAIERGVKDEFGGENRQENKENRVEQGDENKEEESVVICNDTADVLHMNRSSNLSNNSCSTSHTSPRSESLLHPHAFVLSDSPSPITRTFALQCLSRAVQDVASLPPPVPFLDSLTALLRPASQWLPSLLSTTSPAIQVHLFTLLHLLLTFPSCEFAGELQQHAVDTGCFLRILRCALMDDSLYLRVLARSLLVLLSFQNETAVMLIHRCFPRKIVEQLENGTFESVFEDLCTLGGSSQGSHKGKIFLPLQQAVWDAIRKLPSPRGSLDFPALFQAYEGSSEDYQLVWRDVQRKELQEWLDNELEKWEAIQSSNPQARWNHQQAAVRYTSYDYDLILFDCFLPHIASLPAEFGCSSLETRGQRVEKRLDIPQPNLFFTSLYARLLTIKSNEKRELLLKCLRVVYHQFRTECGEFFDEEHILTMIREEVNGDEAVLDALLRFFQSLLVCTLNGEKISRNDSWVPLLLEILMRTHANQRSQRARVILDILYGELERATQPIDTTRLPRSTIVEQLSAPDSLKVLVDVLFLPFPEVVAFAAQLIYRVIEAVPSCQQTLCRLPIVDALLLQPSLDLYHVQLLKALLTEKALFAGILPDAVLYGLQVLSDTRFVGLYNENSETALIIWNQSMRDHLHRILHAHVDPYIALLSSNPRVEWECIPLPHIHYPELDDDVYCGRYYLRRLIDLQHPTSLKNPKGLLLALRNEWVREGKRRGLSLTMTQAREILGVDETADEMTLIHAFWKLWKTDVDHGVLRLALDMLTGVVIVASSPVPSRLYLIVQTQCFLYQHYHARLLQFVFPSFKMLVAQIQAVVEKPEQLALPDLVSSLVTLVLLTCVCSVENAESFVQVGGLTVLYHLLQWNDQQSSDDLGNRDEAANQLLYQEVTILVHLSHHSSLHVALSDASYITEYLIVALSRPLPDSVLSSILKYFINLSSNSTFTTSLLHTSLSVFITAIPLLFRYNLDEEESREKQFNDQCNRIGQQLRMSRPSSISGSSMTSDVALSAIPGSLSAAEEEEEVSLISLAPESGEMVFSSNAVAKQAVQFLSSICANCSSLGAILTSLLTPSLMGLVLEKNTDHLLSILNSDFYESPFIIWTQSMRSQLLTFLEHQQAQAQQGINHFSEEVSEFVYDAIRNELLIGDVYVRVFNEQKPKQFVKAPKYFMGLLAYLRLQRIGPKRNDVYVGYYETTLGEEYVLMMLTSLLILLEDNNELADSIQSADDLLLLFSFLLPRIGEEITWELAAPCTLKAIDILLIITKSPRIASLAIDQHASDIVIRILIQEEFQNHIEIFRILYQICLNSRGYERVIFTSGLWLLFLHLILLPQDDCTDAIRKMCVDIFQGWGQNEELRALSRVMLRRFLPEYMVSILTDRTDDALGFFDTATYTAEMIWNNSMKSSAATVVEKAFEGFVAAFEEGSEFVLDEDMEVEYEILKKELVVGGVFVSVYLNCEHYKLKLPQDLMDGLMKEFCNLANLYDHTNPDNIPSSAEEEKKRKERLDMIINALRKECKEEGPAILDYFASSGYINRIVEIWEICDQKHDLNGPIGNACCSIVLEVVENNECAAVLIRKDTLLRILKDCLLNSTDNSLDVSSILLSLFKSKTTDLFKYVIELNMIPFLFSCIDNSISVKDEEDENTSSEIYNNVLKTLLAIEKLQFMRKDIEEQFKSYADWPVLRSTISSVSKQNE